MDKPQNGLEFLEELRRRNSKETQSFKSLFKYLEKKAREKGVPLFGQFELTPLCNFNCRMCYVHLNANQLDNQEVLSVELWKKLMYQAVEAGMISATLTGGECLAYPGFDELYVFLQDLGCEVSVLTNGYLLDAERIDFFRKRMPASIKVSLYGWNEDVYERVTGHRVFKTVVENVQKAIAVGLPISLSITPSIYLGEDVFETIRLGKSITNSLTINSTLFSPREETGRSGQQDDLDTDLYIRIYRLMGELDGIKMNEIDEKRLPVPGGSSHETDKCGLLCGGGRSGFSIDWKGTLMPCTRLDMICAYPLESGFKEAWEKVNHEANKWPTVPECKGCAYFNVCKNCAADMLKYAKPGQQPIGWCQRIKSFVKHGIGSVTECEE